MRWISLIFLFVLCSPALQAKCTDNEFINPIDDVVWDCIFPISIMGFPIDYGEHPPDSNNGSAFCECPGKGFVGAGFTVGFWEPARIVETVKDAGCFPAMGMEMDFGDGLGGYGGGGSLKGDNANMSFQHFHYYIAPFWAILGMFTDSVCQSNGGWDVAMVSEVRPDWGDDLFAAQLYPETALMANPIAVFTCIADAVASAVQRPIDALYWCMGAWGLTYPMSGHITTKDYVAANAGIAGKAMFVQARTAQLLDRAVNYCSATPVPIWIKSHWRIQQSDPVADNRCHAIGHPGILWTDRKNPVGKQDNFAWVLFRKVNCCVVVF